MITFRTIVSILTLLVSASILISIIYISVNFEKLLNKGLKTGMKVVKNNKQNIQPVIDNYTASTVTNLMTNEKVNKQLEKTCYSLNDSSIPECIQLNVKKIITKTLDDPDIQNQLNSVIKKAVSDGTGGISDIFIPGGPDSGDTLPGDNDKKNSIPVAPKTPPDCRLKKETCPNSNQLGYPSGCLLNMFESKDNCCSKQSTPVNGSFRQTCT